MTIQVLIADDHQVVRRGLSSLFEETEITVIGEAADGNEAVEKALALKPDVILMDVRMPEADGLQAMSRLRTAAPDSRTIMLSMYDNPTYVARAVALGAWDYLMKDASREVLIETIRRVAAGEPARPDSLLDRTRSAMQARRNQRADTPLTNRESQVLRHIALGLSNREIAVSLEISIETVKEHVQNILRKIDATDRTQAAIWATRKELLKPTTAALPAP